MHVFIYILYSHIHTYKYYSLGRGKPKQSRGGNYSNQIGSWGNQFRLLFWFQGGGTEFGVTVLFPFLYMRTYVYVYAIVIIQYRIGPSECLVLAYCYKLSDNSVASWTTATQPPQIQWNFSIVTSPGPSWLSCPVWRGGPNSKVDLYTALCGWEQLLSSLERRLIWSALNRKVPLFVCLV